MRTISLLIAFAKAAWSEFRDREVEDQAQSGAPPIRWIGDRTDIYLA